MGENLALHNFWLVIVRMKQKIDKIYYYDYGFWLMVYVFLSIREVCKNKNEMVGKESIEEGEDILLILIFSS